MGLEYFRLTAEGIREMARLWNYDQSLIKDLHGAYNQGIGSVLDLLADILLGETDDVTFTTLLSACKSYLGFREDFGASKLYSKRKGNKYGGGYRILLNYPREKPIPAKADRVLIILKAYYCGILGALEQMSKNGGVFGHGLMGSVGSAAETFLGFRVEFIKVEFTEVHSPKEGNG